MNHKTMKSETVSAVVPHYRKLGFIMLFVFLMVGYGVSVSYAQEVFHGDEGAKPTPISTSRTTPAISSLRL